MMHINLKLGNRYEFICMNIELDCDLMLILFPILITKI